MEQIFFNIMQNVFSLCCLYSNFIFLFFSKFSILSHFLEFSHSQCCAAAVDGAREVRTAALRTLGALATRLQKHADALNEAEDAQAAALAAKNGAAGAAAARANGGGSGSGGGGGEAQSASMLSSLGSWAISSFSRTLLGNAAEPEAIAAVAATSASSSSASSSSAASSATAVAAGGARGGTTAHKSVAMPTAGAATTSASMTLAGKKASSSLLAAAGDALDDAAVGGDNFFDDWRADGSGDDEPVVAGMRFSHSFFIWGGGCFLRW